MKPGFHLFSSRRAFLAGLAAVMPAICFGRPGTSHAARADVNSLMSQLELEEMKSGRPKRTSAFQCSGSKGKTLLWTQTDGRRRPVCALNETGRFIWEACDGNHTVDEISEEVHERFLVSYPQARTDVLSFLYSLKMRGAVQ